MGDPVLAFEGAPFLLPAVAGTGALLVEALAFAAGTVAWVNPVVAHNKPMTTTSARSCNFIEILGRLIGEENCVTWQE